MRLNTWGLALSLGLVFAIYVFFTGFADIFVTADAGYGRPMLEMLATFYPGYNAEQTIPQLLIATGYGFVDGAVCGLLTGLFYNAVTPGERKRRPAGDR